MRDGATRERRTPSRCIQGSYAPERWWRGDQPWDRTTFSRASAERYDHTSSLVVIGADGGSRTRACALRGRRAAGNTSSTWSRLEDSNLDSPVIGRKSCRWTKPGLVPSAGVEPASFRLKGGRIAALPRRDEAGCRAGIRTRIFPRNRRTCYLIATTLQKMVGSGGLEPPRTCARGRWATDYPTTRRIGVSDGSRTR